MDIPTTMTSPSRGPGTSSLVTYDGAGDSDTNDAFWDPTMNLLLTFLARKHNYDWEEIGNYMSRTFAEHGLIFTVADCETRFKQILETSGLVEQLPSPRSPITRLLLAQLRLTKEIYKGFPSLSISSEECTENFQGLMQADELEETEMSEDDMRDIILAALPTDEEDLENPDPVIMRMRKLRKKIRLQEDSDCSSDYDGESSDLEDDEYEPLREVWKKWNTPEETSTNGEVAIIAQSDCPQTYSIGSLEKNKIISRIFEDLFRDDSSQDGNGENKEVEVNAILPDTQNGSQSLSSISLPDKKEAEPGETSKHSTESREIEPGVSNIVAVVPDSNLDVEMQQWESANDLGRPTDDDENIVEDPPMGESPSEAAHGSTETTGDLTVETGQATVPNIQEENISKLPPAEIHYPAKLGVNPDAVFAILMKRGRRSQKDSEPSVTPISPAPPRQKSTVNHSTVRGLLLLHDRVESQRFSHLFDLPTKKSPKGSKYYNIIKNPTSLKTIRADVRKGAIADITDYESSLSLMFLNTTMFNKMNTRSRTSTFDNMIPMDNNVKLMAKTTSNILEEYTTTQQLIEIKKLGEDVAEVSVVGGNPSGKGRSVSTRKRKEAGGEEKAAAVQAPRKKKSKESEKGEGDEGTGVGGQ